MRLRAWAWLALSSLQPGTVWCADRPHYGGTLAIDLSASFGNLEPGELPAPVSGAIAETLVRINPRGDIEPCLALSWQRELDGKRWRFSLRPKVAFHDGEPFNAASAAPALLAALKKTYSDVTVIPGGQTIVIQSETPMPDLLAELASPRSAILRTSESGAPIATGPFRAATWEPGRRLALQAFEDHWAGRPFLDSAVINLGAAGARADLFDIPFASTRRILPEGTRIWSSPPHELVALVAANVQPPVWQALALSIDRGPIASVLAQRRAEPAFALLPQWLSGYAFLFRANPDLARARQTVSSLKPSPLILSYPANDSFARAVADRIALNARDAGLNVQPNAGAPGNLRLVRWQIESADAAAELARLAALLGVAERAGSLDPARPNTLYDVERGLLESNRILPVLHLPSRYGMATRVHNTGKAGALALRLEDLWVDP